MAAVPSPSTMTRGAGPCSPWVLLWESRGPRAWKAAASSELSERPLRGSGEVAVPAEVGES